MQWTRVLPVSIVKDANRSANPGSKIFVSRWRIALLARCLPDESCEVSIALELVPHGFGFLKGTLR